MLVFGADDDGDDDDGAGVNGGNKERGTWKTTTNYISPIRDDYTTPSHQIVGCRTERNLMYIIIQFPSIFLAISFCRIIIRRIRKR